MTRLQSWFFTRHLDDDEQMLVVVHRHWLLGIKTLVLPTLGLLLCGWFLYIFRIRMPVPILFLVTAAVMVVVIVWWMRNFFDYYLDAWLITDQGVIDVEWHGWFHRQSTRVLYSDIQGVSYEIQGVLPTLLRYGEIGIEKISTGNTITMEDVPAPRKIEGIILRSMEAYLHSKNLEDAKEVQQLLATVVARELKLRGLKPGEASAEGEDDDDEKDDDEDS